MTLDTLIAWLLSLQPLYWGIILTGLLILLPIVRFGVRTINTLLAKDKKTNEYQDIDDLWDENMEEEKYEEELFEEEEEYTDESWEDTTEEEIWDYEEESSIEEEKHIVLPQSDTDETTKEHLYRERLWSEIEYNRRKSRRDEYEKKLIEGLAHDGDNHDILKTLADYYFTIGQTKKSLPLLKKIVDHSPDDHKTLWQIAEIYLEWGDFDTSELLTNKALAITPETPKYAITLTEIYYHTGRIDEAIQTMEEVVKRRPSRIPYREALIKLYEEAEEYELALECCQSILEIDTTNIKAKKKSLELRNKL
jgi:tetratricopeptide (TPR) repeat protein